MRDLLFRNLFMRVEESAHADWQSAIQQAGSLRYRSFHRI
jgi:hypothetical protein